MFLTKNRPFFIEHSFALSERYWAISLTAPQKRHRFDFQKSRFWGGYQTRKKTHFCPSIRHAGVMWNPLEQRVFWGDFRLKLGISTFKIFSIVQFSIFLCFKIQISKTQRLHFAFYSHKYRLQYWPF